MILISRFTIDRHIWELVVHVSHTEYIIMHDTTFPIPTLTMYRFSRYYVLTITPKVNFQYIFAVFRSKIHMTKINDLDHDI